jgi:hypothetical protein
MLRLAETAAKWDLDSEKGYIAFHNFAREGNPKKAR